jgi:hypothetical protein
MNKLAAALVLLALVAAVDADAKSDATAYFKKHFPNKLDKMDGMLEKYAGKEDKLLNTLQKQRATMVLSAHFAKYKPERGAKVSQMVSNAADVEALVADFEQRTKDIEATRYEVESFYRTQDMEDRIAGVDATLEKYYGREHKIMEKLKGGDLKDAAGNAVKLRTFSKSTGGYIDLLVAVGLAFGMFIVCKTVLPGLEAKVAGTAAEKAPKATRGKGGNNKKKLR